MDCARLKGMETTVSTGTRGFLFSLRMLTLYGKQTTWREGREWLEETCEGCGAAEVEIQ